MDTPSIQTIFEGDDFSIYRVEDEDGEVGYDVTFYDTVTVHFIKEEWNAFVEVVQALKTEE